MLRELECGYGWRVSRGDHTSLWGGWKRLERCEQVTSCTCRCYKGLPQSDLDFYLIIFCQTEDAIPGFTDVKQVFYPSYPPSSWFICSIFCYFYLLFVCVHVWRLQDSLRAWFTPSTVCAWGQSLAVRLGS